MRAEGGGLGGGLHLLLDLGRGEGEVGREPALYSWSLWISTKDSWLFATTMLGETEIGICIQTFLKKTLLSKNIEYFGSFRHFVFVFTRTVDLNFK